MFWYKDVLIKKETLEIVCCFVSRLERLHYANTDLFHGPFHLPINVPFTARRESSLPSIRLRRICTFNYREASIFCSSFWLFLSLLLVHHVNIPSRGQLHWENETFNVVTYDPRPSLIAYVRLRSLTFSLDVVFHNLLSLVFFLTAIGPEPNDG